MNNLCRSTLFALSKIGLQRNLSTLQHSALPRLSSALFCSNKSNVSLHVFQAPGLKRAVHTEAAEGDKELVEYLDNEIKLESKNVPKEIPGVPGFEVKSNGAEVVLTKEFGSEKVQVSLNVNHSVGDGDFDIQDDAAADPTAPPMVSRPTFQVEVVKGGETLSFNCSFSSPSADEGEGEGQGEDSEGEYQEDLFTIDDLSLYGTSEQPDNTLYSVSADVMDGEMYERLMDYLADRGIDDMFCNSLMQYATVYEGHQFLGLLERVKAFVAK